MTRQHRHQPPQYRPHYRPRAPSPEDEDSNNSDNTYSVVHDDNSSSTSSSPPQPPPKLSAASASGSHRRLFGDSVDPSPSGSVLSGSSSGGSSLYSTKQDQYSHHRSMAAPQEPSRRQSKTYDAATVEEIKAQFQQQIENMLQSQQRNKRSGSSPGVSNSHIPSSSERELSGIRELQRGKSFAEARTAVQRHIEKMLLATEENNNNKGENKVTGVIKHGMHGVSHAIPGQEEPGFEPPPPVHYGVGQAIKNGIKSSLASGSGSGSGSGSSGGSSRGQTSFKRSSLSSSSSAEESKGSSSKWRSVESLLSEQHQDKKNSLSNAVTNKSDLSFNKFRSAENLSSAHGKRPVVVDINLEDDHYDEERRRRKMDQGRKMWPDLSPPSSSSRTTTLAGSYDGSDPSSSSVPEALKKEFIRHKVDYLGALPISARATNLAALQRPLKDLYFKYRALRNLGQSNLPGTLEISDTGLTVQYIREMHKGVQEIFNPFPTIAVWAAVKFVHRRDVIPQTGGVHHQYAFLPLISDPDSQEKHRLFHDLDLHEVELAADAPHPPVFACVMRRAGVPKQLECHGFVCASSEDAIIIAANLYQALLETMRRQRRKEQQLQQQQPESPTPPPPTLFSDSTETMSAPVRPPRRKKKSSSTAEPSLASSYLQRRRSGRGSSRRNKRVSVTVDPIRRSGRGLSRNDSGRTDLSRRSTRRKKEVTASTPAIPQGDVYTRVAIPRSKSFMNVGSQYNLQELFRELKEKEGVESIDDVLKKVITPNGISFNEIKPVYRELLLKLAMTMSQDEIFQRSKNIIAQEKKKKKKKQQKNSNASDHGGSTLGSFFKLTFSSKNNSLAGKEKKNKKVSKAAASQEFLRPLPPNSLNGKHSISKADISGPLPFREPPHIIKEVNKAGNHKNNDDDDLTDDAYASCCSECATNYESVCNYGNSCSRRGEKHIGINKNTRVTSPASAPRPPPPANKHKRPSLKSPPLPEDSSDDVSCDGDSCSDKCYCSIRVKQPQHRRSVNVNNNNSMSRVVSHHHRLPDNTTIIHCNIGSSDTISSRNSSNSCFSTASSCSTCQYSSMTDTASYSIRHNSLLSGCESPQTAWKRNSKESSAGYHSNSCSNSSSGDCSSGKGGNMKRANSKILLVSATDRSGKVMYRGAASSSHGSHAATNSSVPSASGGRHYGGNEDDKSILSMKKSAEIAAVFSGAKINQTTDIVDELRSSMTPSSSSDSSSTMSDNDSADAAYVTKRGTCLCGHKKKGVMDMGSSLGYFP